MRARFSQPPLQPGPAASFPSAAPWAACGLLVLLVFAAFGHCLHYGLLNWDDLHYLQDYPEVEKGLSLKGFAWAWTHSHHGNWHPLSTLSFMLDASLFGKEGAGFHLHNLLLHSLAAFLLFLTLRQLSSSLWRSAPAAALFAVHPLRVESVVWIAERKDVLSGVFLMATLLAYVRYAQKPSRGGFLTAAALFACGLLAKSILVTLPLLLLLLDIWPLRRIHPNGARNWTWWRLWPLVREKLPLIALSVASCIATLMSTSAHSPLTPPPLLARLGYIPVWYTTYLRHFLCPLDLAAHYPYARSGPSLSSFLGCSLLLGAISVLCFRLRRQLPLLYLSWMWFLIALLPVIGIVPPGIQLAADRYTYVAHLGFAVAAAWGLAEFHAQCRRKWIAPGFALTLLSALVGLSIRQTRYWASDETLWRHTLEITRENAFAHAQLGDALTLSLRLKEAVPLYQEALRLDPNLAGALNNLGLIRQTEGNLAEAETLQRRATLASPWFMKPRMDLFDAQIAQNRFTEALKTLGEIIELAPNNFAAVYRMGALLSDGQAPPDLPAAIQYLTQAIQLDPQAAQPYVSLGNALFRTGKIPEAIRNLQSALQKDPTHAGAAHNLGIIFASTHRMPEAEAAYRQAIRLKPDYLDAYYGLVDVAMQSGQPEQVRDILGEILRQKPSEVRALYHLSWLLATHPSERIRNGSEAERLALRALALGEATDGLLLDALAAAYAEQNRFEQAIETALKALASVTAASNPPTTTAIQSRIERYRHHQPFRMSE